MKKLVCELCGSGDMIKKDGYYICQACETKYSVEEAKKLLIEGPVDVSGSTIKVDYSSYIEKSLENARRARSKEDWDEVEKYYNQVESQDPHNIEAIFYSAYGKARMAMVDSDRFKREQKMKVLCNSISIIDDNYNTDPAKYSENKKLIQQISDDLINFYYGKYVYNYTIYGNGKKTDDSFYTEKMFKLIALSFIDSIDNIIRKINSKKQTEYLWKILRQHYVYLYEVSDTAIVTKTLIEKIDSIDNIIKSIDKDYIIHSLLPNKYSLNYKKNVLIFVCISFIVTIFIMFLGAGLY